LYLPLASYKAQHWRYDQPWRKLEKPAVKRGRAVDRNGNPLEHASPPEFFSDMAACHWIEFDSLLTDMLDDMEAGVKLWPFFQSLPSLEPNQVGQPLSKERFEEDWSSQYDKFFKTFRVIHDGEVLELEGAWVPLPRDMKGRPSLDWQQAWMWHVQYATNQAQRGRMEHNLCPGTRLDVGSTKHVMHGTTRLPIAQCQSIGMDTTVHRINGQSGSQELRTATVLTWPQLFIMGAHAQLTALEIYIVGLMCQLIMAPRAKSKGGKESRDKYRAKKNKAKSSATTIGADSIDQTTHPADWWQTRGWQDAGARWWQTPSTAYGGGTWVDQPPWARDISKDWPNETPNDKEDMKPWRGWHAQRDAQP